jgi:hypothetical protein
VLGAGIALIAAVTLALLPRSYFAEQRFSRAGNQGPDSQSAEASNIATDATVRSKKAHKDNQSRGEL